MDFKLNKIMKKALIIITITLIAWSTKAQGNLQFNQVLSINGTLAGSSILASTAYTVPSGKVWKLESTFDYAQTFFVGDCILSVNNIYIRSLGSNQYAPDWYTSGDIIKVILIPYNNGNNYIATTENYRLSIIEYNIVQ